MRIKRKIYGQIANFGCVCGQVRIIQRMKDLSKVKSGDILVMHIIDSEFITIFQKIGAIITDIGGITSHAAVLSREFNIPCIVDTKNATQVLQNGDWIKVDANNGAIEILEQVKNVIKFTLS